MNKHLEIINKTWKGLYVTTQSKTENADGIFDHLEWLIPEDIYNGGVMKVKCFLLPKYEEDKEIFGVDENGYIVRVYNVDTFNIAELDEQGNMKKTRTNSRMT